METTHIFYMDGTKDLVFVIEYGDNGILRVVRKMNGRQLVLGLDGYWYSSPEEAEYVLQMGAKKLGYGWPRRPELTRRYE